MRKILKLALTSLLFATLAWSQAPPASIYSLGGMQMSAPRASVYSGPSFSQPCCGPSVFFGGSFGHNPRFNVGIGGPRFGSRAFGFSHRNRHFGRQFGGQGIIPVFVPYYVPSYDSDYPIEVVNPGYDMTGPGTYERPSDTARRVYGYPDAARSSEPSARNEEDNRYGEHYLDSREALRQPATPRTEMPNNGVTTANGSDDGTPTVLIFRDGRETEIGNYAIMGTTIFVLSGERSKIPLSEVDVPKTQAANYQRGIDFRVPPTK